MHVRRRVVEHMKSNLRLRRGDVVDLVKILDAEIAGKIITPEYVDPITMKRGLFPIRASTAVRTVGNDALMKDLLHHVLEYTNEPSSIKEYAFNPSPVLAIVHTPQLPFLKGDIVHITDQSFLHFFQCKRVFEYNNSNGDPHSDTNIGGFIDKNHVYVLSIPQMPIFQSLFADIDEFSEVNNPLNGLTPTLVTVGEKTFIKIHVSYESSYSYYIYRNLEEFQEFRNELLKYYPNSENFKMDELNPNYEELMDAFGQFFKELLSKSKFHITMIFKSFIETKEDDIQIDYFDSREKVPNGEDPQRLSMRRKSGKSDMTSTHSYKLNSVDSDSTNKQQPKIAMNYRRKSAKEPERSMTEAASKSGHRKNGKSETELVSIQENEFSFDTFVSPKEKEKPSIKILSNPAPLSSLRLPSPGMFNSPSFENNKRKGSLYTGFGNRSNNNTTTSASHQSTFETNRSPKTNTQQDSSIITNMDSNISSEILSLHETVPFEIPVDDRVEVVSQRISSKMKFFFKVNNHPFCFLLDKTCNLENLRETISKRLASVFANSVKSFTIAHPQQNSAVEILDDDLFSRLKDGNPVKMELRVFIK